jgi:hypothetical protein
MQHAPAFEEDLTESFQELRRSLLQILEAIGANPAATGEMSRRLGLNRNLTWKLAKLLGTSDLYTALTHLPGEEGIEILSSAFTRAGAPTGLMHEFAKAREQFARVIQVHSGDRATFDLILDSMGGTGPGAAERLEQSRKLAFRGNSGIWGVQTRVRSTTIFAAPSPGNSEMLDTAVVGGVVDFRRLRPGVRWPLFRPRMYHDDGTPIPLAANEEAIDPAHETSGGPKLLGEFCSENLPKIVVRRRRRGVVYELGEGPVGNTGTFTCFFGTISRSSAPRRRTEQDRHADMFSQVAMPAEMLQFDLIAHQDLDFLMSAKAMLVGSAEGDEPGLEALAIPLEDGPLELAGRPPVLLSPQIPRYAEMVASVFAKAGWNEREFRAIRLIVKYPPMHSSAVLRAELPE